MARRSDRALWAAHLAGKPKAQTAAPATLVRQRYSGVVLGIDPSLRGTGLAVIQFNADGSMQLLASQTLRLNQSLSQIQCLGQIAHAIRELLAKQSIRHVASEATIYVQNTRTALTLGTARGACFAPVAEAGLDVFEYPPRRIKQAVTGSGRASKEQVTRQVETLLGLSDALAPDEADAAATALCHAWNYQPQT